MRPHIHTFIIYIYILHAYFPDQVYGDVDGNGYFWAEIRGHYGLVPAGKLVEIAKDDLFMAAEQRGALAGGQHPQQQQQLQPWSATTTTTGNMRRMRWGENIVNEEEGNGKGMEGRVIYTYTHICKLFGLTILFYSGSIKSRSYEHTEGGKMRRQRAASAYMDYGGSDQEGGGMMMATGGVGWRNVRMMPSIERRMSTVEGGGEGGSGSGSGYRLPPTINGGGGGGGGGTRMLPPSKWRGEEMDEEERRRKEEDERMGGGPNDGTMMNMMMMLGGGGGGGGGGGEGMEEAEEAGELQLHQQQQQQSLRGAPSQLMMAKYDYDSRQLSPNGNQNKWN
jgi:hypothetical protein